MGELPAPLSGRYLVRVIRPALHDAKKFFPRMGDRAELRRQALKLRFWPEKHPEDEAGTILDVDWSWIVALKGKRIGELRIAGTVGGLENLRIIFFDPGIREPLPMLWVLAVMPKKRDDFTRANLETFAVRRQLVLERFYEQ